MYDADEMMAAIAAKRLVEALERSGFVVMKKPPGRQRSVDSARVHQSRYSAVRAERAGVKHALGRTPAAGALCAPKKGGRAMPTAR